MQKMQLFAGAWSAAPTPFTDSLAIDAASVRRMIKHHIRLRQKGIFIGGSCGEGPWLPRKDMRRLSELTVDAAAGKMNVAVQVTDNSYAKVLENIREAKADGADIAIVAEPWLIGPMTHVIEKHYMEIAERSVLPIGVYSRSATLVPLDTLKKVLNHPNVVLFKDSSVSEEMKQLALEIGRRKPSLLLLTGYELGMTPYLQAGYHGILAGGGVLIGDLTAAMVEKAQEGDFAAVSKLQTHCDRINYAVYGGRKIKSWLTGLKYCLIKMGIFSTMAGYLQFPLPQTVKKQVDKMLVSQKNTLFPSR